MKGFDVLKVKSAVKSRNKFDLSRTHLTTTNFGQILPMFVEETVPGDKFQIDAEYFSRMAPLVKPTYGKFQYKTVTAFVPYHQIAWDADAWLAGKTSFEGQTPLHRFITIGMLDDYIRNQCTIGTGANSANTEYTYIDATGVTVYRKFTAKGRYIVNILNSLGYSCPQGVDLRTSSTWKTTVSTVKLSAYPLLSFFKLYNDYMSQSQRFNVSQLSAFLNCVKYGKGISGYNASTGEVGYSGLATMFDNLKLNYENDYFTSAWQKPNTPLSVAEESNLANAGDVPGMNSEYVVNNSDGTAVDLQSYRGSLYEVSPGVDGVSFAISQRALDFLKSFDDWVRRNNYSGSRAVQQIYSRFGIKTDEYKSHYANVISTDSLPIQVGDVTATADASGVPLGDYAGKGIMSGVKNVNVSVDDYGLILILGYFTVTPMNSFGFDRRVLRNSPLDYYNPEFDGIGADAISLGEFFENPIATSADSSTTIDVYGYTERYNAYRYGRDVITGEFRNYHNDGDMNTWHTGRLLNDVRASGNLVAQSSSVNCLEQTGSQYNRIFSVTDDSEDKFYVTARFNVSAIRPMMNLNQVVKLGEGDTAIPRNGNVIS